MGLWNFKIAQTHHSEIDKMTRLNIWLDRFVFAIPRIFLVLGTWMLISKISTAGGFMMFGFYLLVVAIISGYWFDPRKRAELSTFSRMALFSYWAIPVLAFVGLVLFLTINRS